MSNENKAVATVNNMATGIASVWSTFEGETQADKLKVLAALTNAEPIADNLNKKFNLANFVVQATSITDTETGELEDVVRTVLVDDKGKAYAGVSNGLVKALENLVGILGHPSKWDAPIPVEVTEVRGRNGHRFYTLKIA